MEEIKNSTVETLKWCDLESRNQAGETCRVTCHTSCCCPVREYGAEGTSALSPSPAERGWTSRGPQCHVKEVCGIYLTSLDVLFQPFFPDLLQCSNTLLVTPVCERNQIVNWVTLILKNSFTRRHRVQHKMAGMPQRTQQQYVSSAAGGRCTRMGAPQQPWWGHATFYRADATSCTSGHISEELQLLCAVSQLPAHLLLSPEVLPSSPKRSQHASSPRSPESSRADFVWANFRKSCQN